MVQRLDEDRHLDLSRSHFRIAELRWASDTGPPLDFFSPLAGIAYAPVYGIELTAIGADGRFYSRVTLRPDDTGAWRKIDVSGFTPKFGVDFVVTGDFLAVLASDGTLWATVVDHSANHLFPSWESLPLPGVPFAHFSAALLKDTLQIVAVTSAGAVRGTAWKPGAAAAWSAIDLPNTTAASVTSGAAYSDHQAKFFVIGTDSKVYTIDVDSNIGWPGASWTEVAPNDRGIEALASGRLAAAISRVSGQVEIYAQTKDKALNKAWWS